MKSIRSNPLARINPPRRGSSLDVADRGRIDLDAIDLDAADRAERIERTERTERDETRQAPQVPAAPEDAALVGCWEADTLDAPAAWSRGMYRLLGVPPTQPPLSHDELAALVSPADRGDLLAAVRAAGPGGGWDCEARVVTRDGRERVLRLQGRVAPTPAADPSATTGPTDSSEATPAPRLSGVVIDVTHAHRAAREEAERFRLTFGDAPVGLALVDVRAADGPTFAQVNKALAGSLGRPNGGLAGLPLDAVTHPDDAAGLSAVLTGLVAGRATAHRGEARWRHADGRDLWVLLDAWVPGAAPGEGGRPPRHAVLHVEDITARRRAELELSHRALHDGLTGLPNRALLLDHLAGALARAERQGTYVAVMFLDLDHFKEVNDTLGHDAGDRLLVDVAGRLRRCLRETDTAARLGGDEFVVVCEGLAAPDQAAVSAGRIARTLRTEVPAPRHPITVTVSVGVATSRGSAAPADLLRAADAAMYRAKERGCGRFEVADPPGVDAVDAADALEATDAAGTFPVAPRGPRAPADRPTHYEPAVDLGTGRVTAVEALLAGRAPSGAVPGGHHGPGAARRVRAAAGHAHGLLEHACRRAVAWYSARGDAAPDLWLDAPVRELGRGTVVARVAAALQASGLPPHRLSLEVPERQLLGLGPAARADLTGLAELGVRLAVDDARGDLGTWAHLDRVPVHAVKLGASLVGGLGHRRADGAVVRGVVALAHALDMRVVATGVATGSQRTQLGALGCDLAQGAAVRAPVPSADVDRLVTVGAP
jgi:diguanylate cyclase (GGDEF)-like protein/PAS domain S-box-containing protein